MNGRAFFDTNVLLYMYGGEAGKRARAKDLFREYALGGRMLLSTQVVQEFYAAGAQRLGMPRSELRAAAVALLDSPLVIVAPAHIESAIDKAEFHKISFWDALILAAAEAGGAEIVYTEDLNDGQQYGAVVARNPFRSPADAPA